MATSESELWIFEIFHCLLGTIPIFFFDLLHVFVTPKVVTYVKTRVQFFFQFLY